jgi:hypothetical protein
MQGLEETSPLAAFETLPETPSGDCETGSSENPRPKSENPLTVYGSGTTVFYRPTLYTQALLAFKNSTHVLS